MDNSIVTLRIASDDDIGPLGTLLSQSYTKLLKSAYPPSLQVMAIPIISRPNRALIASGSYYVAVDPADRIIGAGGWTHSVRGPNIADIRHVATAPNLARRGIARRILLRIEDEAREARMTRLDCLSTRIAVPFYRAMGFAGDREVTVWLRPGIEFPVVQMSRRI